MKKLSKVVFVLAVLLMIVLPLSARKAMNVSWEWLLSDPDVTAYRYQLNGEDGEWTVVDGNTSSYTAKGLDPYTDYTLYLQCSYDGVNWSVSATSTAYHLLEIEPEPEPVVEEVVVEEPVVEEPAEEAEAAIEEVLPVISTIFTYRGITSNIVVYSDNATLTIPAGTTNEDIATAASAVLAAYPEAQLVTYYVEDGTVYLTYPAQSDDYLLMALSTFESDAEWYIDMIYASLEAPVEEAEPAAEAAEEEVVLPLFSTLFSYRGVTSEINAYGDHATLTIPEGVSDEDIAACAAMLVAAYPEASAVTYSSADGVVELYYPEQSADFIEGAYAVLETEAEWLIDYLNPVVEEAVEEETVEEEVVLPVISTIFTYRGITSNIVAYSDNASITLPEGTTEKDVAECAEMLLKAYPEAAAVTYSVEDGTVYLTYPSESDEFITLAVSALEGEAKWYIDSLYATIEAEKAAAVETAPAAEGAAPAAEAAAEEPAAQETPAPVAVETVKDSPKAEAVKASFNLSFSLGAEFGFKSIDNFKEPSIFPRFAITLEGRNLVHFGAFGIGLRSDISFVMIPEGRTFKNHELSWYLKNTNWGFDGTADLKLMTYVNTKNATFYLGAGMGFSLASNAFTYAHSSEQQIGGFNTAWALTGVAGFSLNLGKTAYLSLEGYGRYFFTDLQSFKFGELSVAASLGLGFRF